MFGWPYCIDENTNMPLADDDSLPNVCNLKFAGPIYANSLGSTSTSRTAECKEKLWPTVRTLLVKEGATPNFLFFFGGGDCTQSWSMLTAG